MELFSSADGLTARIRVPGGRIDAANLPALVEATRLGDGYAHITSRGNLQLRQVPEHFTFSLGADVDVLASPLSPTCARLARAVAARLPSGAPLVGIDDGSGDILSHHPEHGLALVDESHARLLGTSEVYPLEVGVDKLVALEGGPESPAYAPVPLGWLERADGTVDLGGITAFGKVSAHILNMLTVLEADVSVTPWRSLIIHELEPGAAEAAVRVLAPLGVSFDAQSPWARVTACIGAPACRHALSDVRADASRVLDPGRVHVVGCEKACGRPAGPHTEYLATGDGEYEVTQR